MKALIVDDDPERHVGEPEQQKIDKLAHEIIDRKVARAYLALRKTAKS